MEDQIYYYQMALFLHQPQEADKRLHRSGLIEVFPYAAGVMILLTMALLRWPRICIIKLSLFSAIWIISLVYGATSDTWNVSLKLPKLWLILEALLIPIVVVLLILADRA